MEHDTKGAEARPVDITEVPERRGNTLWFLQRRSNSPNILPFPFPEDRAKRRPTVEVGVALEACDLERLA